MDRLGTWFSQTFDHLKNHFGGHVVPTLVMFGIIMVLTTIMIVVIAIGAGIGIAIDNEQAMAAIVVVTSFVGTMLLLLTLAPLQLGYMRGCLCLMRGERFELSEFTGSLRDAPSALFLMFLVLTMVSFGSLFCYVPGFIIAALFSLSFPAMADRRVGAIEALKISVRLVKSRLVAVTIYVFLMVVITSVLSYVPIVGALASLPVGTTMMLALYLDLSQDEPPGY